MVYYRKYRSQTIDELDNGKIRQILTSLLLAKEFPHAFLFTGPKGLGKTSTARILAKAINCRNKRKGSVEPCNICDICNSITNGSNLDVIEIDGASNRGIDEIRDLREKVRFAPVSAKMKVYIIDEVHMLTGEAFNALLKTIEEPPSHIIFIFCTTEVQKVPATILSRCFQIIFTPATFEELTRALKRVIDKENILIDNDALELICVLADGGFRDAIKLLEESVLVNGSKRITKQIIEEQFSIYDIQTFIIELLGFLQQKNIKDALNLIEQITENGTDMKYFLTEILNTLHSLLLQSVGVKTRNLKLKKYNFTVDEIAELTLLFSNALTSLKYAVLPQLPIELAVIAWGQSISESKNQFINDGKPTIADLIHKQKAIQVKKILDPDKNEKDKVIKEVTHEQKDINGNKDVDKSFLENLIYKTKPYNHSVAAVLRGCIITDFTQDNIILETSYKFHKERLEEKKTQDVIEKAIKEITGKIIPFRVVLKNK